MKFVPALSSRPLAMTLHIAEKSLPGRPQGLAQFDQKGQRGNVASGLDLLQIARRDVQFVGQQFLTAIAQLPKAGNVVAQALGMYGQRSRTGFGSIFHFAGR